MFNRVLAVLFSFFFILIGASCALPYSNIYVDNNSLSGSPQSITATSDGGVLVAGSMITGVGFLKLDSAGNIQWQKGTFGNFGVINSVKELTSGGFVAAATISQEIVVFRFDNNGNLLWSKQIETNVDTDARSIIETSDGGFVLCGFINQNSTNYEGLIVKLDASGTIVWQKIYGGSGFDQLESIIETSTGFCATGATFATDNFDLWLLQLDQNGNLVSSKSLGGSSTDQGRQIIQAEDGSLLIVGRTYSFGQNAPANGNSWILKFDSDGNTIWQKVFGGDLLEDTYWINEDENGDLLILGTEESFGAPSQDLYFLRLDGSGNLIVLRSYGGYDNENGAVAARQTDGKITISSSNTTFRGIEFALWVFTIDSSGEIDNGCDFSETISTSLISINQAFVDHVISTENTAYSITDFHEWIDHHLSPIEACQTCPRFTFDPPALPDGELGVFFSATITASGGEEPYTYFLPSDSLLPDGLSLDPDTGIISGIPTLPGVYSFNIGARDSNGCAVFTFYVITINGDLCSTLRLTPNTLSGGRIGEEYNQLISAVGGTPPYNLDLAGTLPDGLFFDNFQGIISGIPTTQGTSIFDVQVFDSSVCFALKTYFISVSCPEMFLTPTELPSAQTTIPYSIVLTASGGQEPYNFTVAGGVMPFGLSLDPATGEINGVPFISGSYTFTIAAFDQTNCAAVQEYTIVVSCSPLEILPETLPFGAVNNNYTATLSVSGGTPSYLFYVESGQLPDGLVLNTFDGTISGIPTVEGTFNFVILAFDGSGCPGHRSYSLEIRSSCLLCDDFEDGILDPNWNYLKPSWNETAGFLIGVPTKNQAVTLTGNAFAGCLECSIQTEVTLTNNTGTLRIFGWYLDKDNHIELTARDEKNTWALEQHSNGIVVTKAKGKKNIQSNQPYPVKVDFDGSVFHVFVDDLTNPLFTMTPAGIVNSGEVGFEAKGTSVEIGYLEIK